jgi:hypothetical protein
MWSRSAIVWLLLALLVMMPGAVFASRSIGSGDTHGQSSSLQHTSRSGTAWRNFSSALVAEVPRLVLVGDHQAPVADVSAPPLVLLAPIFVPPRS